MAARNCKVSSSSSSSSSSIDPKSGFCSETKIYHSLRPNAPLPPETTPLSVADFVSYLLHQNSSYASAAPPALIDAATRRRISYPDLEFRSRLLAASLQSRFGLSKGDSAFILSPNSLQVPILCLSLLSLGVVFSPSNPVSSSSEIALQIELCKPVIAFATSDVAYKVPPLRYGTILLDSARFDTMMTVQPERLHPSVEVSQSDTAAILYSSGTTGRFKGVELSHRNFISSLATTFASRPVRPSPAVVFCGVPYFHVYGFTFWMRAVVMGLSVVAMGSFDLRLMIRAIEEFRVTHLAVAPSIVVALLKDGDLVDGRDLSSLEVVSSGGAPLPIVVIERFKKRFPGVQLAQAYGLTETTARVSVAMGASEAQRVGASGRLIPNCQAKIVDLETGIGLPPLKHGELWVKGPYIMKGYVDEKEETAKTLDSEGWLRTGDICYFDNDGFLYIVDRIKDLIKYKGYQVAPVELENLLQSHPDIVDAAVIPYPDEEAGQVPVAFVVRRHQSTIDESQVEEFVAKQVAPYKKIRQVVFTSSIPKHATGKLLRKELIKLATSEAYSKL